MSEPFTRTLLEDPENPGEVILDLGNELCELVGWQPGDEIEFVDNKDGTWTLKKTTTS